MCWAAAVAVMLWLAAVVPSADAAATESCLAVRSVYRSQGFREDVPSQPISGNHLKICRGETTCCTEVMETSLSVESRQKFDTNLKNLLNPLANLFSKKNLKINEVFYKLLNQSRKNFDEMFSRTYGILYQQNSYVFTTLYDELENYFRTGEQDLRETMDNFFKLLYQRMFTVFNVQYTFNARYLRCVTHHMEQLKPFGEVPKKLTTQIKRSFVALRTFAQGLAIGRDVVKNVLKVNPSISCVHELMKMTHCATCDGHQGVRPCLPYCREVINLCLIHHQPLVESWISYVDAMVKIGERLENPFNIDNVVQPVNYKISDAIMNFQESGVDISKKVFKGCGPPQLGRRKREAVHGELTPEFLDFRSNDRQDKKRERETDTVSVSRHVHEIKTKIRNSRDFWSELPTKMCRDAASEGATSCWTGTKLGKYEGSSVLNVSEPHHSSEMDEQIMRIKVITNKLLDAYMGRDVSWIDEDTWLNTNNKQNEETVGDDATVGYDGSGSGSGDGPPAYSGHYPPDDEDAYTSSGKGRDRTRYTKNDPYDDDEDIYLSSNSGGGRQGGNIDHVYEGSGAEWDRNDDYEGSGAFVPKTHRPVHNSKPPREPPSRNTPKGKEEQPPSGASKETMSLTRAITIYMLPAILMFLGTIA